MGRKGVSKRKPKQTKAQPYFDHSGSSVVQPTENAPVKPLDTGKATPVIKGRVKPFSDKKGSSK